MVAARATIEYRGRMVRRAFVHLVPNASRAIPDRNSSLNVTDAQTHVFLRIDMNCQAGKILIKLANDVFLRSRCNVSA